ncbi:MAG: PilZ domain-containing protein [Deltaproteobacteria bacterium]|nr:PilZ domain-containing protein [Deltaproteobacteria bacterium]
MRWAKRSRQALIEDMRESPRFDVAIAVRDQQGDFVERYGKLGINGFYFETTDIPMIGQNVRIRVALLGLGVEIETSGTVISVLPADGHVGVAARFEEIPFETERIIARWLDMMTEAHSRAVAG